MPRHAQSLIYTPFPILRSDIDLAISKGRRQKPDDVKEIPSSIKVPRESIREEDACLQLTFDGNVIAVREGQAFPDFAKALKKHHKKIRRDVLTLNFDANVISDGEGQDFFDFASVIKRKHQKDGKKPHSHSSLGRLIGSIIHAQ